MKVPVSNEYGKLRKAVVCEPVYLKIEEAINVIEAKFLRLGKPVIVEEAVRQHRNFVRVLRSEGVKVISIPPDERLPEQVYVEDIGVSTERGVILGRFSPPVRKGEVGAAKGFFEENKIPILHKISEGFFEGGDFVYLDEEAAAIGLSSRTTSKGVAELQRHVSRKLITVRMPANYLHLGGLLNVISEKECVLCSKLLPEPFLKTLKTKGFETVDVKVKELEKQLHSACNVLALGNRKLVSFPQNKEVNAELRKRGFDVIEVEIGEILKGGGSFGCITFSLERENA